MDYNLIESVYNPPVTEDVIQIINFYLEEVMALAVEIGAEPFIQHIEIMLDRNMGLLKILEQLSDPNERMALVIGILKDNQGVDMDSPEDEETTIRQRDKKGD